MKLTIERVKHDGGDLGVTIKEVDGEKFYCLADIAEQTNKKSAPWGNSENMPQNISGRFVWGHRFENNHYIETIFVDENCMRSFMAATV